MDVDKLDKMANAFQLEPSRGSSKKCFNSNNGKYIENLAKQAVYYQNDIQQLESNDLNLETSGTCETQKKKDNELRGASACKRNENFLHDRKIDQIINLINK